MTTAPTPTEPRKQETNEPECKHEWGFVSQRTVSGGYMQTYRCNVCQDTEIEVFSEHSWFELDYPRNRAVLDHPTPQPVIPKPVSEKA